MPSDSKVWLTGLTCSHVPSNLPAHPCIIFLNFQIASIAATRVESMRDLLIRQFMLIIITLLTIMIIITLLTIMIIMTLITIMIRWEEMSISGEKDTMDFQPLTQFLKCYAIYFASWTDVSGPKNFNLFSFDNTFPSLTVSCTHVPHLKFDIISTWINSFTPISEQPWCHMIIVTLSCCICLLRSFIAALAALYLTLVSHWVSATFEFHHK